jgi:predicted ATPase
MSGWAQAEQGARARGIAQLRQGLTAWEATGSESQRTYFLALLAESLGREGQIENGLGVLDESLDLMDGTGEGFHSAELHRLRGEFLLQQGQPKARTARRMPVFSGPSPSPGDSRPNRWSCGPR